MLLSTRHEWELEGDLAASVFLNLSFMATVRGNMLDELKLINVSATAITFAMHQTDVVCDGASPGFGRQPNPELPDDLLYWFARRFQDEYDTHEHLRQTFRDDLEQAAIDRHFELLARRGAVEV